MTAVLGIIFHQNLKCRNQKKNIGTIDQIKTLKICITRDAIYNLKSSTGLREDNIYLKK